VTDVKISMGFVIVIFVPYFQTYAKCVKLSVIFFQKRFLQMRLLPNASLWPQNCWISTCLFILVLAVKLLWHRSIDQKCRKKLENHNISAVW